MMKRLLAALASLLLVTAGLSPSSAREAFDPTNIPGEPNEYMFQVGETILSTNSGVVIQPGAVSDPDATRDWYSCTGPDDQKCDYTKKDNGLTGFAILPVCSEDRVEDCIESLSFKTLDGTQVIAELVGYSEIGSDYPRDNRRGYPGGTRPAIFKAVGANHSSSDHYAVMALALSNYELNQKRFVTNRFTAQLVPVDLQPKDNNQGCFVYLQGFCGVIQEFDDDLVPQLVMRLHKDLGGWFRGRLEAPNLKVENYSKSNARLTVSGTPVLVPRMGVKRDSTKLSAKEKIWVQNMGRFQGKAITGTGPASSDYEVFDFIKHFRSEAKDTALGETSLWSISTMPDARGSKCLEDKSRILGIVTTNAMGFEGSFPAFRSGFLNYRVTGLHFLPDGTEAQGKYDLVMRSDVARCLYNFNNAPLSASVTISGEGDKNIATTVVSEKNGWLKLAAYGFTFSEKTIKVKLTQKKQTTITCVATGKKSKKVTAVNPKCPKGFKKR